MKKSKPKLDTGFQVYFHYIDPDQIDHLKVLRGEFTTKMEISPDLLCSLYKHEIWLISLCFALINQHGIVGVFSQAEKNKRD